MRRCVPVALAAAFVLPAAAASAPTTTFEISSGTLVHVTGAGIHCLAYGPHATWGRSGIACYLGRGLTIQRRSQVVWRQWGGSSGIGPASSFATEVGRTRVVRQIRNGRPEVRSRGVYLDRRVAAFVSFGSDQTVSRVLTRATHGR